MNALKNLYVYLLTGLPLTFMRPRARIIWRLRTHASSVLTLAPSHTVKDLTHQSIYLNSVHQTHPPKTATLDTPQDQGVHGCMVNLRRKTSKMTALVLETGSGPLEQGNSRILGTQTWFRRAREGFWLILDTLTPRGGPESKGGAVC